MSSPSTINTRKDVVARACLQRHTMFSLRQCHSRGHALHCAAPMRKTRIVDAVLPRMFRDHTASERLPVKELLNAYGCQKAGLRQEGRMGRSGARITDQPFCDAKRGTLSCKHLARTAAPYCSQTESVFRNESHSSMPKSNNVTTVNDTRRRLWADHAFATHRLPSTDAR